jgi:hypothetical protein
MIAITQNEATAANRRLYFYCVDATDGITPETGEAAGQPQISVNGGAFANTTNTLVAISNGHYYVELTQAETNIALQSVIRSRYKSANTTETEGSTAQIFSATPTDFASTASGDLGVLITDLRRVVKDTNITANSEILWNELEWIEYLNSAEREICERAHVLEDSTTAAVCTITLVTATATYSLHNKILYVKSAVPSWGSDSTPLLKRTEAWLDKFYLGWRDLDDSEPDYIIEKQTNQLQLVPGPSSDYNGETLALTVDRLPLVDLSLINTTPEIGSKYYDDMKYWALYRAFSKKDAEIYDAEKATQYASRYYNAFEARVGPRPSSNVQRIMKQEPTSGLQLGIYRR